MTPKNPTEAVLWTLPFPTMYTQLTVPTMPSCGVTLSWFFLRDFLGAMWSPPGPGWYWELAAENNQPYHGYITRANTRSRRVSSRPPPTKKNMGGRFLPPPLLIFLLKFLSFSLLLGAGPNPKIFSQSNPHSKQVLPLTRWLNFKDCAQIKKTRFWHFYWLDLDFYDPDKMGNYVSDI